MGSLKAHGQVWQTYVHEALSQKEGGHNTEPAVGMTPGELLLRPHGRPFGSVPSHDVGPTSMVDRGRRGRTSFGLYVPSRALTSYGRHTARSSMATT